jgi:hypothetical protein
MLNVRGYQISGRIRDTPHSAVYAGLRMPDGLPVVLKLYRSSRAFESGRASRELELLQRIDSDWVVRPVALVQTAEGAALVLRRARGTPLSRGAKGAKLSIEDFLRIALGIGRGLIAVHGARVIHKDVKPSNVLVDREQQRTCLIDFGICAEFGRAEHSAAPKIAEGTLHYIAPEQTGRLGLGIDFRTDLYSMGATLYELLTGAPPFGRRDGPELMHAHIAQRPRPAAECAPRVPRALSRIVEKLLEKDPELRYQTAHGLVADLEACQKQLEAQGEIDPEMALGTADVSDRLRFPSKLYGREREVEVLRHALGRISHKGVEWVLLAGPAGIGKSSLPAALRDPLLAAGGYMAEAKFDADRRERPYAGFAAAFEGLVNQILAGSSNDRLGAWSERLRHELGSIGAALLELAPSLRYLIDDLRAVPALGGNEERERLALAVVRFVRAAARPAHPLVLFFDDLQWADAGSLGLLSALLCSGKPESLLVIGGYRSDEVGPDDPLMALIHEVASRGVPVETLTVEPLKLADTTAMLADVLGRSSADTAGLARCVGRKTQHNPLLVRRLMFHLWDRDLIRHEHGSGWTWDEQRLAEAEITDDAAAMVAARIDMLSEREHELLRVASLVGAHFDFDALVELSSVDRLDLHPMLMTLVEQGLIAPCPDGFKFVHDRIREAAQSRMDGRERAMLHQQVARLLHERTPQEDLPKVVFQLADHLLGALDLMESNERSEALTVLHLAGATALARGATDTAAYYLERARDLLARDDWERGSIASNVYLASIEASLQLRRFEVASGLLSQIEQRPLPPLARAQVIAQRVVLSTFTGRDDPIALALDGLRAFGIRWPRHPSYVRTWIEMVWTHWLFRGPIDERMFPGAPPEDSGWLAPLLILRAVGGQLGIHSNRLACLAVAFALRAHRRSGAARSPGVALSGYANICCTLGSHIARAERYAQATEFWLRRMPAPAIDVRCRLHLDALIYPWVRRRRLMLEPLQAVVEAARELGDLEYVSHAAFQQMALGALAGETIARVRERLEEYDRTVCPPTTVAVARRAFDLLLRSPEERVDWGAERAWVSSALAPEDSNVIAPSVLLIASLCVLGQLDLAAETSARLWQAIVVNGALGSLRADHTFYRGFASAALADATRGSERRRHLRVLCACLRRLRAWSQHGPDFVHMAAFLEAEMMRSRRRPQAAMRRYEQAARQARSAGYDHHAALIHERRADLLRHANRSTDADMATAEALELYRKWGASAKVCELTGARRAD